MLTASYLKSKSVQNNHYISLNNWSKNYLQERFNSWRSNKEILSQRRRKESIKILLGDSVGDPLELDIQQKYKHKRPKIKRCKQMVLETKSI